MDTTVEDWRIGKTVQERNGYMLEHKVGTDVTFSFSAGGDIKAHKLFLVNASQVFEHLLDEHKDREIVKMEDMDADIFRLLLRFIYTDDTPINDSNIVKIMSMAEKYKLPLLLDECDTYLANNLTLGSVFLLLEQALELHVCVAKEICLTWIEEHSRKAFNSPKFLDIKVETLDVILQRDDLRISEFAIYSCCRKWAEFKLTAKQEESSGANIRRELGSAFFQIRFPAMQVNDFALISGCGVLKPEEELILFRQITLPYNENCNVPFATKSRFELYSSNAISAYLDAENTESESNYVCVYVESEKDTTLRFLTLLLDWAPKKQTVKLNISMKNEVLTDEIFTKNNDILNTKTHTLFECDLRSANITLVKGNVYKFFFRLDPGTSIKTWNHAFYYLLFGKEKIKIYERAPFVTFLIHSIICKPYVGDKSMPKTKTKQN